MFLTKQQLTAHFGVDAVIAAFFVDRAVPAGNMYWKDKLLYLRQKPGYLFIPLYADLLFRLGMPKDAILHERFVGTFEFILDGAAREEFGLITEADHLEACMSRLMALPDSNKLWLERMERHFMHRTEMLPAQPAVSALQRADAFLFALAALPTGYISDEDMLRSWYALVGFFLLLDDIDDYQKDQTDGDPNALLQWGDPSIAAEQAKLLISSAIETLTDISPVMGNYCMGLIRKFDILPRLDMLAVV